MAKNLAISIITELAIWAVLWVGLLVAANGVAMAQGRLKMEVAMVVGDEVRTVYDVEKRIELLIFLNGSSLEGLNRRSFFRSVQDEMVEELLRRNAAKNARIEAGEEQIEFGFQNVANSLGVVRADLGSLLRARGLSLSDLRVLLESELLWTLYKQRILAKTIVVSDAEIAAEKKRLEEEGERLSLRRIGIAYNPRDKEAAEEALWKVRQIRERLLEGSSFAVLAKNFSQDSYKEEGGKVGWVLASDLPDSQREEVLTLEKGALSKVIVDDEELVLFLLEDKQEGGDVSENALRERLFLNRLSARTKKRLMVLHNNTYVDIRR